jgi:hypothetical protein
LFLLALSVDGTEYVTACSGDSTPESDLRNSRVSRRAKLGNPVLVEGRPSGWQPEPSSIRLSRSFDESAAREMRAYGPLTVEFSVWLVEELDFSMGS